MVLSIAALIVAARRLAPRCPPHTELILLASAYMEVTCVDPYRDEMHRHWVIRRTVDYSSITLQ